MELIPGAPPRSCQIITDVIGNPEEERRAEFYQQPWAQEAVGRHIFAKVSWGGGRGAGGAGTHPWDPGQRPPCPLTAAVSPGPAAPAGTGTSARDPPHLRRGPPPPRCPSRTVPTGSLSTCTDPTCLEGGSPPAPLGSPGPPKRLLRFASRPSPRTPAGFPLPWRSQKSSGSREALPVPGGGAASPTPSPAGPALPLSTKVCHSKRQLPPAPTFCTIFVNRFYIKKKKYGKKKKGSVLYSGFVFDELINILIELLFLQWALQGLGGGSQGCSGDTEPRVGVQFVTISSFLPPSRCFK